METVIEQLCRLVAELMQQHPEAKPKELKTLLQQALQVDIELAATLRQGMTQSNSDNARGYQTLVQGGVAYIGDQFQVDNETLQSVLEAFLKTNFNQPSTPQAKKPAELPNNLNRARTGAVNFVGREDAMAQLHQQSPLLIYFPGMDGAGTLFYRQTPYLAPWFDIRCLAIPYNDLSSWEQLTACAIALIKQSLNPNHHREIYLCGESFGGCLALKIAEQAPELSAKLILINPATSFAQQSLLDWGVGLTAWLPDWFYRGTTWGFLPFLTSLHRIHPGDRANLLHAMQSLSPSVVSWRLSLLNSFNLDRDRLKLHSPTTLILASGCDRLLPSVTEARRLRNILPQAQIHLLPESGHSCLLERDMNLAQILKSNNFLPQPTVCTIV